MGMAVRVQSRALKDAVICGLKLSNVARAQLAEMVIGTLVFLGYGNKASNLVGSVADVDGNDLIITTEEPVDNLAASVLVYARRCDDTIVAIEHVCSVNLVGVELVWEG